MFAGVLLFTATLAPAVEPPNPPIVWLHYDYMIKDGPNGHSHEPDPASIQLVVEAFRAHGITLHIDPQHTAIPETDVLVFSPGFDPSQCGYFSQPSFSYFPDLKARYFHPQGSRAWHYAIFGHYGESGMAPYCTSPEGQADVGGYDFMVTQGWIQETLPSIWTTDRPFMEGGVFMHELGHNLGLLHGGNEELDLKPNYFSVMNNDNRWGILVGAAPGSTQPISRRLDYSDRALPTVYEGHLNDTAGLSGPSDSADIARVLLCPFPSGHLARCRELRATLRAHPIHRERSFRSGDAYLWLLPSISPPSRS